MKAPAEQGECAEVPREAKERVRYPEAIGGRFAKPKSESEI